MKVRKFRVLRIKHGISLAELGKAAKISSQRISELELRAVYISKKMEETITNAFVEIMADRLLQISELEVDFMNNQDSLFEKVKESHEL